MADEPTPFAFDADWLRENFLFGLDLYDSQGNAIPDSLMEMALGAAKAEFGKRVDIKVGNGEVKETHDWSMAAVDEFSLIQLRTVPVREIKAVTLKWGERDIWHVPTDWISYDPNDPEQVQIIPQTGSYPISVAELAFSQHVVMGKYQRFPRYYEVTFDAGLDDADFDYDEQMCIGKIAAIFVLRHVANSVLQPGLDSSSASADGVGSSRRSHMFRDQILGWQQEVDKYVAMLRQRYHGLNMMVV
jgi:hypothetical protein